MKSSFIKKLICVVIGGILFMADGNYFKVGKMTESERHEYKVGQLLGVDYQHNPLNIDDRHAVDMANYIYEDGILQKRGGLKEIEMVLPSFNLTFQGLAVKKEVLGVTHIGNRIFVLAQYYDSTGLKVNYLRLLEGSLNENKRIIFNGQSLHPDNSFSYNKYVNFSTPVNPYTKDNIKMILLGNYIYIKPLNEKLFYRVNIEQPFSSSVQMQKITYTSQLAYTPLVVRNVQHFDNNVNLNSFEDFNLLSQWIRVSGKTHSNTVQYYQENPNTVEKNIHYPLPVSFQYKYNNKVLKGTSHNSNNGVIDELPDISDSGTIRGTTGVVLKLNDISYSFKTNAEPVTLSFGGNSSIRLTNYFDLGNDNYAWFENFINSDEDAYERTDLVFYQDIENPSGKDNWELKYPHYVEGNEDKIYNAKLFYEYTGLGTSVLFVTDGKSNVDYHSVDDNYLYFSDLNYSSYGSGSNPIKGYQTLQDGSLCVLKDDKVQEPTIYFRTAELVQAVDYEGTKVEGQKELQYPIKEGNTGETLVNEKCFVNFGNETLFLSKNGLQRITVGATSSALIRYSECCSENINRELKQIDSDKVELVVLNDTLEIIDHDKEKMYVTKNTLNINGQYEWFIYKYDNNVISNMISQEIIEDKILFTTNQNRFFINDFEDKMDIAKVFDNWTQIIYDSELEQIKLYSQFIPQGEETINPISNIPNYDSSEEIDISNIELGENEILVLEFLGKSAIKDENNVLYSKVIVKLNSETNKIELYDYETKQLINVSTLRYSQEYNTCLAILYKYSGIESFYITKPYNFGDNLYSKNVYRYIVERDTIRDYDLKIGVNYKANYSTYVTTVQNTKMQEWFDMFDFNTFALNDWDNPYATVYKTHIRKINTLQFVFRSDSLKNSVINPFTIEYTYGFRNKGGM